MNKHLQKLQELLQQAKNLSAEEKKVFAKAIKDADDEITVTEFKLDRTEKAKRTTAILLEETIEELEQKRKLVEYKNRDLEVEAALERVRAVAMGMRKPDDMLDICRVICGQLEALNVKGIRNVQTAVIYELKEIYVNYEYYRLHDKALITEVDYDDHPIQAAFVKQMLEGPGAFFTRNIEGAAVREFLKYQKTTNVFIDNHLTDAASLNYYWYSMGPVALGLSAYAPLSHGELEIFERFRNVFEQTYIRFLDLQKAEAQAIQAGQDLIEIKAARKRTEDTLNELRATQKQLIQSEKMASLGELTAGIAHEIQNPLNFVNNFSEVSIELLAELQEEAKAGHAGDVIDIAADLTQNLEKINHHGRRADAIVKGMLEHSRASTGQKQPTDLNKLADEYLRLAYHGLRAKDKSFNAELITHYDGTLPKIKMVPQDMGRVILNILNNAFYATQQKAKNAGTAYKPEVTVATIAQDGQAVIKVKDNGSGIPADIKDKIMQPFFTTKPTGEGTGLGLSLSYDIVVKGHSGKIDVLSKDGEYTEFIVTLPV